MKKFEGRKKTQSVLCIPQEDLDTLNDITCDRPLRQGRHRGRHDALRDATAGAPAEAQGLPGGMRQAGL